MPFTPPNVMSLLSVKTELETSLAKVDRELADFFTAATADATLLEGVVTELQRVQGVLQILSLPGAAIFCGELLNYLQEMPLLAHPLAPSIREVISRAQLALAQYLTLLTDGQAVSALQLFPEYQALHQLRGLEMVFAEDLFFPELNVLLPEEMQQQKLEGEVSALVKSARMQYQQALLKWLRHDQTEQALLAMQAALQTTLSCLPRDGARAFWWVAVGLMDSLIHHTAPSAFDAKKLLGQLDRQLKSLIDHVPQQVESLLREMLYVLAYSAPVTESIAKIKQAYTLAHYLPSEPLLPTPVIAGVLAQMNALLNDAEQIWELSAKGDAVASAKFFQQAQQMAALSEQLDRATLQWLCQQISEVAARAVEPERAQRIAPDMAMALLLLRHGIAYYRQLNDQFHEQAGLINKRLQAGMMRMPENGTKLNNLVTLYCEMSQAEIALPLTTEMRANLQHIEQGLNAFFADVTQHKDLLQLEYGLHQIQGGLHFLSQELPEQVALKLRLALQHYAAAHQPSATEMHWIARALSSLEACLQELGLGQQANLLALQAVLQEWGDIWNSPGATAAVVEEEMATGVSMRTGGEDEELLEVFLEEASEVIETLHSNLALIQAHLVDRAPLVIIRRAFHTLKGSGRMVGLKELGEVAWAVERAMNKWLLEEQPTTPSVLELIGDAKVLFQHWIELLRDGSTSATIDATPLIAAAYQIENGTPLVSEPAAMVEPVPSVAEPQEAVAMLPPVVEAEPEWVVIGSVSLSPMLFSIATEEASSHIGALKKQWQRLRAEATPIIPYDFMRSAHTLAGVNRTMGFLPIAELAYALELWLEERIGKAFEMDEPQRLLLEQTVTRLDGLCACVRERQEPLPQTELIQQLQASRELPARVEKVALPPMLSPDVAATPVLAQSAQLAAELVVKSASPPVTQDRAVRDEVDAQLLPIFLEEANELYPQISKTLRAWRELAGADTQLGRNLQRSLHTLKGSARMAGAMRLGELTHRVEGRVDSAISQALFDETLWNELENDLDRIAGAIEELAGTTPLTDETAGISVAATPAAPPMLEVGAERAMQAALLRVRSDTIDRLVNEAGEVSVARSRVELELREFKNGILELTDSVYRLRQQLREIEIQAEGQIQTRTLNSGDSAEKFDPLEFDRFTRFQELTRFMNESVHDVQTIQHTLLKNLSETEAALTGQGRINRELQQGLMAIRMVPFASVSERLYRVVRQTGKELGKRANLELSGVDVELDRSVLEKMTAPFEHLLRNAIAHGLETPEQREQQGKTSIGEIRLSLRQESNEVVFDFSDDGAGLNMTRLQQKALEQGVLQEGEVINPEQAIQMIFKPGLSTAQEVTEIAGRGVGLDVVRSEVSALGGRMDVVSTPGKGVRFTIHLPLTLAVTRTLMVRAGKEIYALPATMVEQVQQVKPSELEEIYQARQMTWQGKRYPLHYLARLLAEGEVEPVSRPYNALLLLHSGDNRIALHVDELIGNQEVVVKNIGPQLARLPGISGATVTGNGAVVLIINPIQFVQQLAVSPKKAKAVAAVEPVHRVPLVMVVDDSLTVRKITSRLLLRVGYQVVTAKDGEDALLQLADLSPAVMLLDVEMPRMDGFELTKRLRQEEKTKDLPIIMITSRTADKHRNYALEIGVNEYLGKPYQEEMLLAQLTRYAPLAEIDMPL